MGMGVRAKKYRSENRRRVAKNRCCALKVEWRHK